MEREEHGLHAFWWSRSSSVFCRTRRGLQSGKRLFPAVIWAKICRQISHCMKSHSSLARCLLLGILTFLISNGQGAEVRVFAAASLTDSLKDIATAYAKKSS